MFTPHRPLKPFGLVTVLCLVTAIVCVSAGAGVVCAFNLIDLHSAVSFIVIYQFTLDRAYHSCRFQLYYIYSF